MKALLRFTIIFSLAMAFGLNADAQAGGAVSVTCENGAEFDNGVEFVVNQMRPGFTYTATAIGLDGFDPVLAVLDESGNGLCTDDSTEASNYVAQLPSSGRTVPSGLSSQVQFSQNLGRMADVSLVVGGFGNTDGEFILILEGMAATSADGSGDPFSVRLTPGLVNSGLPLSVYMVAVTDALDPLMYLADENYEVVQDTDGVHIYCDDGGSAECWGEGSSLIGSSLSRTRNRSVPGGNLDSMLQIPLESYSDLDFDANPWYLTFIMTSFEYRTTGDYVVAFHARTGSGDMDTGEVDGTEDPVPTPVPDEGSKGTTGQGVTVICEDGGQFDNGVEFVVQQMRPGFTYTATAIGLNGFDPILAVLDESRNGLCTDDSDAAAAYVANLPSSGRVPANGLNSQVQFSQNLGNMADVSLVVGGFDNESGEFVLILEGMAATSADGVGDPFAVQLTPALVGSDVPLSVYMISVTDALDPLMYLADSNYDVATEDDGTFIYCDDAGDAACWGSTSSLVGSSVSRTRNRSVPGGNLDSMLQIPLQEFSALDFDEGPWYLTFVMTSFEQRTAGDYVIAFHAEAR